jgi:hypothetical protein
VSDVGKNKEDVPLVISSAPKEIWLDLGFDPKEEGAAPFSTLTEVTWSEDNATGHGIRYVKADEETSATIAEMQRLICTYQQARSMFVTRLSKIAPQGLTPVNVQALLEDCDFSASFASVKPPQQQPTPANTKNSVTKPDESKAGPADKWYEGVKFALREVGRQNSALMADEKLLNSILDACRTERNRLATIQNKGV